MKTVDKCEPIPESAAEKVSRPFCPTLIGCLTAYAAGILCAPYFSFSFPLALSPVLFIFLLIISRSHPLKGPLLFLFLFALGISLYHLDLRHPSDPSHVSRFTGMDIGLQGRVAAVYPGTDRTTFDLAAESLFLPGRHFKIHGKVRIYLREAADTPVPGDLLRLRCRLRRPNNFGTPGEFDYPRHLAGQGIRAVASLASLRDVVRWPESIRPPFRLRIEKIRHFLRNSINNAVIPEHAVYLRAILIGDRSGFSQHERDLLSRLGLAHLFSVSGLHMGILFAVVYPVALFMIRQSEKFLLWLGPPRRLLPLLLTPVLGFYLLLAGSGLPAQRAFWMILLAGMLIFLYRPGNPLSILWAAAFGILLWDPPALFSPSFQLSFAAVFAILHLAPACSPKIQEIPRFLRYPATLFLITLCATLATFPIVLSHFQVASAAGLVNNLFAVPLVAGIALPGAMAAALLIFFWPSAAGFLFDLSGRLIGETLALADCLSRLLPGTDARFYATPLQSLGIFVFIVLILWRPWQQQGQKKLRMILVLSSICLFFIPPCHDDALTVTALSVGQGDAILVSIKNKHYLIDGGGIPTSNFDIGERIVAPALARLGIHQLKAVILTHSHPDHYLGLVHILRHFPVGEFWSGMNPAELPQPLREVVRERAIPTIVFPRGWSRRQPAADEDPWIFAPDQQGSNINDRSLAFYCRHGDDSLLLTGDLAADGVRQLVENFPFNHATLLKLPHHGSFSSSPRRLLDFFKPGKVFISVGRNNPHGLPHPKTVAAAENRSIRLYRTDRDNSLRFRSQGSGWQALHWERGLFR
ncbi:MAG: DNA internalization-related competence protein ComEC/Rec2 [Desulfuromonadaceae bacterium]|nr:DNA internalization-related competence protein ComEC/Rec2 [Desulfuromonadaceae bacterium]